MEWSAATAEATQALGLVIEVTKGHEHGVRKHEQGVRKHVRLGRTLHGGYNLHFIHILEHKIMTLYIIYIMHFIPYNVTPVYKCSIKWV